MRNSIKSAFTSHHPIFKPNTIVRVWLKNGVSLLIMFIYNNGELRCTNWNGIFQGSRKKSSLSPRAVTVMSVTVVAPAATIRARSASISSEEKAI